MQGCVQRVFFGDVNAATVRVLAAEGWEVHAPRRPRCCGALQLHTGVEDEARKLARATIAAYEDFDHIVVNVAGCGSAMKEYGYLFEGDERAEAFSAKVRDVHELLAAHEPRAERHPLPLKVAYHDACHLAHAQQVRAQPRALLRGIPELELVEPADWELCCGSAGIYNLVQPEAGRRARPPQGGEPRRHRRRGDRRRQPRLRDPDRRAHGRRCPIYHPMTLLDHSIRGSRP